MSAKPGQGHNETSGRWEGELGIVPGAGLAYYLQAVDNRGNVAWAEYTPLVGEDASGAGLDLRLPEALETNAPASNSLLADDYESNSLSKWSGVYPEPM